jgi:hypothetical protein
MQDLIVGLIVLGCFGYAVNALMPAALRRTVAGHLARWPAWPAPIAQRLQRAAQVPAGCGCDGCDVPAKAAAAAQAGKAQAIRIHRRS